MSFPLAAVIVMEMTEFDEADAGQRRDLRASLRNDDMADQNEKRVRCLTYVSKPVTSDMTADQADILRASRLNNGLEGISGFLWTDGVNYFQVLEGTQDAVSFLLARIATDPRHRELRILSDELGNERAFGDWAMASLPAGPDTVLVRQRVNRFLRYAPEHVQTAFGNLPL